MNIQESGDKKGKRFMKAFHKIKKINSNKNNPKKS